MPHTGHFHLSKSCYAEISTLVCVVAMNNPKLLKRFTYSLRQTPDSSYYVQFDIRLQNQRAKIGLTPNDTLELWITYAEMPEIIASHIDEKTWEAHRKPILEMLATHFIKH